MRVGVQRFAIAACVAICAAAHAGESATPRRSEHALIGRIWDVHGARYIEVRELERRAQEADFVLLGETHDNAVHHLLQRDLIAGLLAAGRKPAIVMEQLDREHQGAVDRARSISPRDAEAIAAAARFDRKGWHWPMYAPIVALALEHELPLIAGNLSREQAAHIMRRGVGALGAEAPAPLPEAARERLARALEEGHCGRMPARLLPAMIAAQQGRDALLAHALLPYATRGAVLIAGNGHARRDFGVPRYLAPARVVVVALMEVVDDLHQPHRYLGDPPEYDFVWFTPRAERADPCEGLDPADKTTAPTLPAPAP